MHDAEAYTDANLALKLISILYANLDTVSQLFICITTIHVYGSPVRVMILAILYNGF